MRRFGNAALLILFIVAALVLRIVFSFRFWRDLDLYGVRNFLGLNVHGMKGASGFVALLAGGVLLIGWMFPRVVQWLTSDDEPS